MQGQPEAASMAPMLPSTDHQHALHAMSTRIRLLKASCMAQVADAI